ncbi:hypothetical protein HA402_011611 [Bradysia odoriphaga]|nr:hypothetical protein HA402_011611 [Bradysia odoriphaga]
MGENILKIPANKDDITAQWVKDVTGHSVLHKDFTVQGDVQEGSGFLSSICRVSYSTNDGKRHSIIIKLLPTNEQWLEFALADASDEREIKFYSEILPDLVEVVPEFAENICAFYNGVVEQADPDKRKAKASMIVMEDLASHGYEMMNFSGSNSNKVIEDLITFMARLHYGAFAVEKKKGIPLPVLYPFMQGITDDKEWMNQMETLGDDGYKALEEILLTYKIANVWEHYEKVKPFTNAIVKLINENGRKHPCLVHADIWPNNIQVHPNLPIIVLDWQLLGYRDVCYDLSTMLYTVLTVEALTKDSLVKWLKKYYDAFNKFCEEGGLSDKIWREWEEFKEFFFTWGSAYAFLVFLVSIYCYQKDLGKYANVFRVLCEEFELPHFLLKICSAND